MAQLVIIEIDPLDWKKFQEARQRMIAAVETGKEELLLEGAVFAKAAAIDAGRKFFEEQRPFGRSHWERILKNCQA